MTATTVTRKFGIKKILKDMAPGYATVARAELAEKLGLTYHHFVRITNAREDSDASLSSDQLLVIAEYFNVSVDELLTPFEEESSRITP